MHSNATSEGKLKKDFPLVSIGMPVFNGERDVSRALRSLLAQTYPNIEIIIADDRSNDGTLVVCQEFADKYDNIDVRLNEENLGATDNYRNVLKLSRGEYFVYASQDDYWDQNFIFQLYDAMQSSENVVVAMSAYQSFDQNGDLALDLPTVAFENSCANCFIQSWYLLFPKKKNKLLKNNMFFHGLIRTKILQDADKAFVGICRVDRHYLLQLSLSGQWRFLNKVLFFRQIYDDELRRESDDIYITQRKWYFLFISNFQMIWSVVFSKVVPVHRKLYGIVLGLVHFLRLIFPSLVLLIKAAFPRSYLKLKSKLNSS